MIDSIFFFFLFGGDASKSSAKPQRFPSVQVIQMVGENTVPTWNYYVVCGLSRLTRSWFEKLSLLFSFSNVFLWMGAISFHYVGKRADIFTADISKSQLSNSNPNNRHVWSTASKKINMYFWFWGDLSLYLSCIYIHLGKFSKVFPKSFLLDIRHSTPLHEPITKVGWIKVVQCNCQLRLKAESLLLSNQTW